MGEDADLGRRGDAIDREEDGGAVVSTRSRLGVTADLGRRGDAIDLEGDEGVALLGGAVVATCREGSNSTHTRGRKWRSCKLFLTYYYWG